MSALFTGGLSALALASSASCNTSDKILGQLFLFVVLMQLFDAIFWFTEENVKRSDPKAVWWNRLFTKIACIFNHLQPLVLAGLIRYGLQKELPFLSLFIVFAYSLVSVLYTLQVWPSLSTTVEQPPAKPGLYWKWNDGKDRLLMYTTFTACISILMLENLQFPANYFGLFMTLGTLGFSLERYGGKSDAGRFWCHQAAYIPLLYQVYRLATKCR